jgi:hypothetical protein
MKKQVFKRHESYEDIVSAFYDIALILGTLQPRHIKVLYWKHKGKDFQWIAHYQFNDEVAKERCKNLYWEARKKLGKYKDHGVFRYIIISILTGGDPEKIEDWPITLNVNWEDFVKTVLGVDERGILVADGEALAEYTGMDDDERLKHFKFSKYELRFLGLNSEDDVV